MTATMIEPAATVAPERKVDHDDRLHSEDGPALVHRNGTREWWRHGLLHRTDGPAIEHADGRVAFWVNGHRTDLAPVGPVLDRG